MKPGLKVMKLLEFILKLKIKRNDWLLVDTCPQAANHCALLYSSFITSRPGAAQCQIHLRCNYWWLNSLFEVYFMCSFR